MADADALRDAGVPSLLPAPTSPDPIAPSPAPAAPGEKVMTLVDHLSELRRRLVISAAAVLAGTVVGFYFAGQLIHILKAPLGVDKKLAFLSPGEAFFVNVKLAIVVGIVLAMPVLLYQLWAFISPGLTGPERRAARPWVPIALAFFAIGVAVAWVILPFAIAFLLSFESEDLQAVITADNYFGFVGTLFLAFGLTMEFPIVLVLLSKVGIITSNRLRSSRRIVILAIAVFSAVVTPGGDLVSPVVLGLVMYLLYELAIVLVKMGGR
jgi:sec-independent protein translocase protein TatC